MAAGTLRPSALTSAAPVRLPDPRIRRPLRPALPAALLRFARVSEGRGLVCAGSRSYCNESFITAFT
jgi:hypothetical protein